MKQNILVVGGTGTLGKEIVKRFYGSSNITVLSRDELKQQNMKRDFPDVEYIIGDICDGTLYLFLNPFKKYDVVFHCAALKHVDVGEKNVRQFHRTNFVGVCNVERLFPLSKFVFFSTDKAVLPINAYGMTKALAEKYLQAFRKDAAIYRWGNILGSRGSVIKSFADDLIKYDKVCVTDKRMTRFWMTIEYCVDFVVGTFQDACADKIMIPDVKAASVLELVDVIARLLGKSTYKIDEIGIRPGEKIHECLFSSHTHCIRSDSWQKWDRDNLELTVKRVLKEMKYI